MLDGLRAEARSNVVVAICAQALTSNPLPKGEGVKLRGKPNLECNQREDLNAGDAEVFAKVRRGKPSFALLCEILCALCGSQLPY